MADPETNNKWTRNFYQWDALLGKSKIVPEIFNNELASDGFPGMQYAMRKLLMDTTGAQAVYDPGVGTFALSGTYNALNVGAGVIHTYDLSNKPVIVTLAAGGPFNLSTDNSVLVANISGFAVKTFSIIGRGDALIAFRVGTAVHPWYSNKGLPYRYLESADMMYAARSVYIGGNVELAGLSPTNANIFPSTNGNGSVGTNTNRFATMWTHLLQTGAAGENNLKIGLGNSNQPAIYGVTTTTGSNNYLDIYPAGNNPDGTRTRAFARIRANEAALQELNLELFGATGYSARLNTNVVFVRNNVELTQVLTSMTGIGGSLHIYLLPGTYSFFNISNINNDMDIILEGFGDGTVFNCTQTPLFFSSLSQFRSFEMKNIRFLLTGNVCCLTWIPAQNQNHGICHIHHCTFESTDNALNGRAIVGGNVTYSNKLIIDSCYFKNFWRAISLDTCENVQITNNVCEVPTGVNVAGFVYANIANHFEVAGNYISYPSSTQASTAIHISGSYSNIHDNRIINIRGNPVYAIVVSEASVGAGANNIIANNIIAGLNCYATLTAQYGAILVHKNCVDTTVSGNKIMNISFPLATPCVFAGIVLSGTSNICNGNEIREVYQNATGVACNTIGIFSQDDADLNGLQNVITNNLIDRVWSSGGTAYTNAGIYLAGSVRTVVANNLILRITGQGPPGVSNGIAASGTGIVHGNVSQQGNNVSGFTNVNNVTVA